MDIDLSPLAELNMLEDLELDIETTDLSNNLVSVISQLKGLKRLQCELYCDDESVEEMLWKTLDKLPNLQRLGTIYSCTYGLWSKIKHHSKLTSISCYFYMANQVQVE